MMASVITEADREALRAKMPIFLESALGVKDLRRNFQCPNPDHEDSSPSAAYYPDTKLIHCFGCGGTWDIFALAGMLYDLHGFVEQAEFVAKEVGYGLDLVPALSTPARYKEPESNNEALFPQPKPTNLELGFDTCFDMYLALFTPEGNVARKYLHDRGIDDNSIMKNGIGFSSEPSTQIPEFCIYEPEASGFIMIPFYNKEFSSANYCIARPAGNTAFNNKEWRPKGAVSTLWREWLLNEHSPILYVAEGVLDAISLELHIKKPCIALCGTGGASRLASILYHMPESKRPQKIMIAMDEDEAGRAAAEQIARNLGTIGIPHATMPPYPYGAKDANEWHASELGTSWSYNTTPVGGGIVPLHFIGGVKNED